HRRLRALASVLPAVGLTLALAACGEAVPKTAEVKAVRTVVGDPKPMEDGRRAVREGKPRYGSEVAFPGSRKIIPRAVDVGAIVRQGDLLAKLDDQDYRNKLKSAEADVVAAQAVLIEAQAAEERYRALLASGSTTRALYDTSLKNLRSAVAKLD